ncbi:ABC transporter ATP-binding protein [Lichenifustis flavocetrariae]|uniref:ABC transporter ATP-binding protein n=1 Tax=Lichenifustis flavocetrariae TaxID=2949735 RepID=A0AA41Z0R6_9HYPH|nr:ABC transporter ATP-binding protein [Lichenifustis flavocetrariae]MCW6511634.1 ABC transporter ATP-binding protein [Lichenifustis flavocetrariae]
MTTVLERSPTGDASDVGRRLVSLRSVSKTFPNGTVALSRLDLDVRAGEFLSLIGPSGCGKSTALRMLAGLTEPSSGEIAWHGTRPEIGFVFQEPTLMPWASVFNNVWLPLRLRGVGKVEARTRIDEALAMVGLSAFAKSYPRELSGGMKMRVSIARALVLRPPLLLMDEPFAALDEITRFKLNNDLIRLAAELGTTVVFVTHSVYESVYLSTRIVVMAARPGRAVAEIGVDAPLERTEDFRSTPVYTETCRRASRALHEAMTDEDQL